MHRETKRRCKEIRYKWIESFPASSLILCVTDSLSIVTRLSRVWLPCFNLSNFDWQFAYRVPNLLSSCHVIYCLPLNIPINRWIPWNDGDTDHNFGYRWWFDCVSTFCYFHWLVTLWKSRVLSAIFDRSGTCSYSPSLGKFLHARYFIYPIIKGRSVFKPDSLLSRREYIRVLKK